MKRLTTLLCLLLTFSISFASHAEEASAYTNGAFKMRDSYGKWTFKEPPKRIAVINWTHTEQLLELGVELVAIADIEGFKKKSPQTVFNQPNAVDLKSLFHPDLLALKATKPDLIIIGYSQRDLLRPLNNIAPVMYFNSFSRRFNNLEKADERFMLMAKLFDKQPYAQEKLKQRDEKINSIKAELNTHFNNQLPELNIATLDNKNAWLFLENSLPFSVAQLLGFKSTLTEKPTKLGAHRISIAELEQAQGCTLLIDMENPKSTQKATLNAKPACLHTLGKTNPYGGAMSRLYLAEAIKKAFITQTSP